jgi:hypothetical protein
MQGHWKSLVPQNRGVFFVSQQGGLLGLPGSQGAAAVFGTAGSVSKDVSWG